MPQVSVIMPGYKTAPYIKEAIASVQAQKFQNWELIVVNDGSPDNLGDIVRAIADQDSRVKLVSQENQGVSVARNTGLKMAQGKYLAFLDSDDIWEPSFLERMTEKIEQNRSDAVYCGYQKERPNGSSKRIGPPYEEKRILWARLVGRQSLHLSTFLFEKSFLTDKNLIFIPRRCFGEDTEFILKALCNAKVSSVPEFLFIYRYRDGSAMNMLWNMRRSEALVAFEGAHQYIVGNYIGMEIEEIIHASERNMSLLLYRTIVKALQSGYFEETNQLLNQYDWLVRKSALPFMKNLKMKIIGLRYLWLWRLIRLF